MNAGQLRDPGPLQDGCDPETCEHRAGGDHSAKCGKRKRVNDLVRGEVVVTALGAGETVSRTVRSVRPYADTVVVRWVEPGTHSTFTAGSMVETKREVTR